MYGMKRDGGTQVCFERCRRTFTASVPAASTAASSFSLEIPNALIHTRISLESWILILSLSAVAPWGSLLLAIIPLLFRCWPIHYTESAHETTGFNQCFLEFGKINRL